MDPQNKVTKLDSLNPETKKQIERLDICLYDIMHIDEAMKTLTMYLFGEPYMGPSEATTVEFYKEEFTEIHKGFVALRKFQRLIKLINPVDDDEIEIGIGLTVSKH